MSTAPTLTTPTTPGPGWARVLRGRPMDQAIISWQRYLVEAGDRPAVTRVREMLDCVVRLRALLKGVEDA